MLLAKLRASSPWSLGCGSGTDRRPVYRRAPQLNSAAPTAAWRLTKTTLMAWAFLSSLNAQVVHVDLGGCTDQHGRHRQHQYTDHQLDGRGPANAPGSIDITQPWFHP